MMKVNVLISHYNGSQFLREQIESILNQKGVNVKIYIRDDGSPDDEAKNVLRLYEKHSDIKVFYGKNLGYGRSFMELVRLVPKDSEYYAFSDQDDVWKQDKLLNALNFIKGHNEPTAYSACPTYVDINLQKTDKYYSYIDSLPYGVMSLKHALVTHLFGLGCTMVWNKSLCQILSQGDYSKLSCGHDNLLSVLTPLVGTYLRDKKEVFYYRQHGKNIGANKGKKSIIKKIKFALKNISNPSPFLLRCFVFEQFKNWIPEKNMQLLIDSINYKNSILVKFRLLSKRLAVGLPIGVRFKFMFKVIANKY